MATSWETIARAVEAELKGSISDAEIAVIGDVNEYLGGNVGQRLNQRDYLILLSPPDEHYTTVPRLGWFFRRYYRIQIILVVKTSPSAIGRIYGEGRRGLTELQAEVETALEHSNLNGLVDNKAGQNFEGGWVNVPSNSRAFNAVSTLYTVVKTER